MEPYKILVVDDNFNAASAVRKYGEKTRGYKVQLALTLTECIEALKSERFDLVTMDIELGNENGLDEIMRVKNVYGGPIIFVSGLSDTNTILSSFEIGADDYICKPFDLEELFVRIERSVRRYGQYRVFSIAGYHIDEYNNKVYLNDQEINTTDLAIKLFILLLKNKNKVLSREQIFNAVWEADYSFSSRVVDTHISLIRKATNDTRIQSIRGAGYAFIDEEN